jgi:hypothetical protein
VANFFITLHTGALDRRKGLDLNYKGPERRTENLAKMGHKVAIL